MTNPARQIFAINQVAKYNRKETTYMEMREVLSADEIMEAMSRISGIKARAAELAEANYNFGSIK